MKRFLTTAILGVFLLAILPLDALAQQVLIPAGQIIGLQLKDDTVTVAAFDDVLGAAAREAGLRIGDQITEIEGKVISQTEDVSEALGSIPQPISLTVRRGSRQKTIHMIPQDTEDGPRLGVYLRQGISGIGTVTWYDPDTGRFGSLGHGVSSGQGLLIRMTEGLAYDAEISRVIPGRAGHPGLLRGTALGDQPFGELCRNTPQGVFGKSRRGFPGQPTPVAAFEQIHLGSASIRSTVLGTDPTEYSVEILKIYPEEREDCRNFLLKVTDPQLLSTTGGIVQGMSGSPIIQDGRLIGAVTHVMVSDPTTGYGIFIGNMLDAAA